MAGVIPVIIFLIFCTMKTFKYSILFILLSLLVGYVSMLVQSESMESWYPFLDKSSLTPPGYVFSLVWGALYVLMGLSAGIVWGKRTSATRVLMFLFGVQLFLNLLWSFTFFYAQMPLLAFVVLVALFFVVALYVLGCYGQYRLAMFLNIPYLLWLLFAAYLNVYIVLFN